MVSVHLDDTVGPFHSLLDGNLFLPKSSTNDRKRRARAGMPEDVTHRSKHQIALAQIRSALPNGIPSRDCIRRVLCAIKPKAFQACFQSWMVSLVNEDEEIRSMIAIDGKTMRRSHDRSRGFGPLHLVSA